MKILPKHNASEVTIFTEMTLLANKHNAINLAQGFPDYEIDTHLKQALANATLQNYNQYAPLAGNPKLIEQLILFNSQRSNAVCFEQNQICITPGATYAIYTALATILQPGDEVIILEPSYDSYQPAIETNGGKPVFCKLKEDFTVDWHLLSSKISKKTRAILVNTPHNPSGKIWSADDWEKLYQLIKDTEIIVISDEVYDLLTYDNSNFVSVLTHPQLKERSYAVFSFGKMFHITGWKIGYIVSSQELMLAFKKVHQYLTFCVNSPAQEALAEYITNFNCHENTKLMQSKRDFFLNEIKDVPFTIQEFSKGSYFQVVGFENISSKSDKDFAIFLTEKLKVATIPMSAFYHDRIDTQKLRFCFSKKEETLLEAAKNLKNL